MIVRMGGVKHVVCGWKSMNKVMKRWHRLSHHKTQKSSVQQLEYKYKYENKWGKEEACINLNWEQEILHFLHLSTQLVR